MVDPIVEEVRESRRKHAERFNYDLHAICEDLKKKEKIVVIQLNHCQLNIR